MDFDWLQLVLTYSSTFVVGLYSSVCQWRTANKKSRIAESADLHQCWPVPNGQPQLYRRLMSAFTTAAHPQLHPALTYFAISSL
jgi:hypothetical protein